MLLQKWMQEIKQNDKQEEALNKPGNTVVIAGPGSGKTKVLTTKIAKLLLEEIQPPQGIVCLTYTRMMAREIEQRLYPLGVRDRPNVFVGTVHGFCLSEIVIPYAKLFGMKLPDIIRIASKDIVGKARTEALKKHFGYVEKKIIDQFNILRRLRAHLKPNEWEDNNRYCNAIVEYEKNLLAQEYLDFDFIIKIGLRLIMSQDLVRKSLFAKFPWMAIDEYQDLGYPLYRIVTEMINNTPTKLLAIGDPNQSIFDFAGTSPEYLRELREREDVQPTIVLKRNYRSKREIIRIGDAVLSTTTNTYSNESGGHCTIIACKSFDEQANRSIEIASEISKNNAPDEVAILHRKRDQLNYIANSLDTKKISYMIDKHRHYDRSMMIIRWLEDLAYWSLAGWKSDSAIRLSFDELLTFWFTLGVGDIHGYIEDENLARIFFAKVLWEVTDPQQTLSDWLDYIYKSLSLETLLKNYVTLNPDEVAEFYNLVELSSEKGPLENTSIAKFSNLEPGICLTTIHSAKGSEYKSAIITGVEEIDETENEKRVLYVGVTRAKTDIYLLYTRQGKRVPKYIASIQKQVFREGWDFVSFIE